MFKEVKSKTLTFSWHHTVFVGGGIVFIKSGARPQDQSCAKHCSWSPGEREEAAEHCPDATMHEKCTVIKLLNTDAKAPCWISILFQNVHGDLHVPGCQNIMEVLAETRFLCASHTSAQQKYIISMRWGYPDLRMPLQEQQNAEAWSTSTVPATGQEPLVY